MLKSYPVHYFKKVGKIELDPKYPFRNIENVGCVMITAESPEDALAIAKRAGYHAFKVSL